MFHVKQQKKIPEKIPEEGQDRKQINRKIVSRETEQRKKKIREQKDPGLKADRKEGRLNRHRRKDTKNISSETKSPGKLREKRQGQKDFNQSIR